MHWMENDIADGCSMEGETEEEDEEEEEGGNFARLVVFIHCDRMG